MKKTNKKSVGKAVAIGAGVAALGAGAYYLLGPEGKKNQKKAKVWMTKMEKEAMQKVATMKKESGPMYQNMVDAMAATYAKEYKEYAPEIKSFAVLLKKKLSAFDKKGKPVAKKRKPAAKKVSKK